jgi:hypothetical protein
MKIKATVSKGLFKAGLEYDLPIKEAMAAIIAGNAEPLEAVAFEYEKAIQKQTRWLTR